MGNLPSACKACATDDDNKPVATIDERGMGSQALDDIEEALEMYVDEHNPELAWQPIQGSPLETENNTADPQGPVLVQAVPADTIAYADLHKMIDVGSPARVCAGVAQLQESLITKRPHTKQVPEKDASRQHLGEVEAPASTSNTPAVVEKAPNTDPEKPNAAPASAHEKHIIAIIDKNRQR